MSIIPSNYNPLPSHGQSRGTPSPSQQTSGYAAAGAQSVLSKDETLQKAIQEYISKLSNEDKAAFRTAPDIIERLQEMQYNAKSPISSSFKDRAEKVLQCIKHFMGSLGIFIQHNPDISSLVLGGVNCILTVGSSPCYSPEHMLICYY